MWQAISRLLSEQLGEGESICVMNCLAGEVHARMAFALCRT
ncbi:hypothetical protein ACLB1T_28990 [Escherichia coli]